MNDGLYRYKAKLIKVIDGDTVDLDIDLGMNCHHHERIRLLGINAPETYGVKKESEEYKKGFKAKARVLVLLKDRDLIVETYKDKKGKYGRYLAKIYFVEKAGDEICLNDKLIEEGLAVPY